MTPRGDAGSGIPGGQPSSAVHGFHLSPADARLLRGPLPPEAVQWAVAVVGSGAHVRAVRALEGGTSSAVHSLNIEAGGGRIHRLVLRRFVHRAWKAREPHLAHCEAAALSMLAGGQLPAPKLRALDPDGASAGFPAVLMTRLPGRVEWAPAALDHFLRRLADLLPTLHATPVVSGAVLPDYRPYALAMYRPPTWASRPEVWLRAIEVLEGPVPAEERVFIHRDYHPGNVLWRREKVSGVVDWVNASIGSPWADVGHCRVNLADR